MGPSQTLTVKLTLFQGRRRIFVVIELIEHNLLRLLARNRDMFLDDSDTDSDDEDFQAGASDNNARDDTDSLTGKH